MPPDRAVLEQVGLDVVHSLCVALDELIFRVAETSTTSGPSPQPAGQGQNDPVAGGPYAGEPYSQCASPSSGEECNRQELTETVHQRAALLEFAANNRSAQLVVPQVGADAITLCSPTSPRLLS